MRPTAKKPGPTPAEAIEYFRRLGLEPGLDLDEAWTEEHGSGYGDVVLPPAWRSMGNFEAVIGIIMFGWSTALLVTVVTHLRRSRYVEPA